MSRYTRYQRYAGGIIGFVSSSAAIWTFRTQLMTRGARLWSRKANEPEGATVDFKGEVSEISNNISLGCLQLARKQHERGPVPQESHIEEDRLSCVKEVAYQMAHVSDQLQCVADELDRQVDHAGHPRGCWSKREPGSGKEDNGCFAEEQMSFYFTSRSLDSKPAHEEGFKLDNQL